jgi:3-dehydrosphinganine reductase
MEKFFHQKYVIVTGGSSGIGRCASEQLVKMGAHVCVVARRKDLIEETLAALRLQKKSESQEIESLCLDVGDREAVTRELESLSQRRNIDILINNAGVAYANYTEQTAPGVYEEMMKINYFGSLWTTRALLPHFQKRRAGNIAFVSSLAGVLGVFGYSAYTPSKFALMGLSDVLRQELKPFGVKVSVLLPPDTQTPQLEHENKTKPAETKAIAGAVKPKPPEVVARSLLQGIASGKFHIVPGLDSKVPYFATRFIPSIVRWFTDGDVAKVQKGKISSQ